jgi:hypothetical protein
LKITPAPIKACPDGDEDHCSETGRLAPELTFEPDDGSQYKSHGNLGGFLQVNTDIHAE